MRASTGCGERDRCAWNQADAGGSETVIVGHDRGSGLPPEQSHASFRSQGRENPGVPLAGGAVMRSHMSDLAQLRIWDDPAIRGPLSWYLDVAPGQIPYCRYGCHA